MKLKALFSVARFEYFGPDSQMRIQSVLDCLNEHLARKYPASTATFGSLRGLLLTHPRAFGLAPIAGLGGALRRTGGSDIRDNINPVREYLDVMMGWMLDGGDPLLLLKLINRYGFLKENVDSTPFLTNYYDNPRQFILDQNILNPVIALDGLRAWITANINRCVQNQHIPKGIGVMAWAIFESNTGKRTQRQVDSLFVDYYLEPAIRADELPVIAETLLTQAIADFKAFDDMGFESWLANDFLTNALVINPALACCLKGVPTPQVTARLAVMVSAVHRHIARRPNDPNISRLNDAQVIVNSLMMFPDRLAEMGATAEQLAGLSAIPKMFIEEDANQLSNRMATSPMDSLFSFSYEQEHVKRTARRLESWGFIPDRNLAARACLEQRTNPSSLLHYADCNERLDPIEQYFLTLDPSTVPEMKHARIREIIANLNLSAYSHQARLNMALAVLYRAIDVDAARSKGKPKRLDVNRLMMLSFPDPKEIVSDLAQASDAFLNAFIAKNSFSHRLMVWAGFDSSVLERLQGIAPQSLRDSFISQDLGI